LQKSIYKCRGEAFVPEFTAIFQDFYTTALPIPGIFARGLFHLFRDSYGHTYGAELEMNGKFINLPLEMHYS